jgi:hypothetical protein
LLLDRFGRCRPLQTRAVWAAPVSVVVADDQSGVASPLLGMTSLAAGAAAETTASTARTPTARRPTARISYRCI